MAKELAQVDVLQILKKREPIFHHPELGVDRSDFENMTEINFYEVGASGRCYNREFVIDTLVKRYQDTNYASQDYWEIEDCQCTQIEQNAYLFIYQLTHKERVTRRATIWKFDGEDWKIFYHQGTIVQEE